MRPSALSGLHAASAGKMASVADRGACVARVSEAHPGHTHACQIMRGLAMASSPDAAFGLIRAAHSQVPSFRRRWRRALERSGRIRGKVTGFLLPQERRSLETEAE